MFLSKSKKDHLHLISISNETFFPLTIRLRIFSTICLFLNFLAASFHLPIPLAIDSLYMQHCHHYQLDTLVESLDEDKPVYMPDNIFPTNITNSKSTIHRFVSTASTGLSNCILTAVPSGMGHR